jgi:putative spermidine/putrescine transport system permease protein
VSAEATADPAATPVAARGGGPRLQTSRLASWVLFALVAIYLLLPVLAVLLYSLATVWRARILPDGFTLDHYASVFGDPRILGAFARSLILATIVTAIDIVVVVPAAYWARVRNPRITPLLVVGAAIPFALPYVVIAFGIDRIIGEFAPSIQNTLAILVVGQAAIAFPFFYWAVDAAMAAAGIERLSEAAETCGARPRQVIRRIVLPAIRVGIITGSVLVFATSFGEFALAQVLVGAAFETLPLWQADAMLQTTGRFNDLAVTTVLSFLLLFVLATVLVAWNRGQTLRLLPGGGAHTERGG